VIVSYGDIGGIVDLNIFYCQIYIMGLNTSFTTYIKVSPVSYIHRSDREHDG
jgi:hypothetical protein